METDRLGDDINPLEILYDWSAQLRTGALVYIRKFKHKFDHAMVKVNFCYRTKCSQVGKSAKRWDLTSLQDDQTVIQFNEKLREQGVGITTMEWKMLATTVTDVAESIIPRESPQQRNRSYLSANTKELILEAKICDSERARLMRRAVYRSKRADYRTYVAECTELVRQANDQHNMREVHRTVRKLTGKKRVQSNLSMNSNERLFCVKRIGLRNGVATLSKSSQGTQYHYQQMLTGCYLQQMRKRTSSKHPPSLR